MRRWMTILVCWITMMSLIRIADAGAGLYTAVIPERIVVPMRLDTSLEPLPPMTQSRSENTVVYSFPARDDGLYYQITYTIDEADSSAGSCMTIEAVKKGWTGKLLLNFDARYATEQGSLMWYRSNISDRNAYEAGDFWSKDTGYDAFIRKSRIGQVEFYRYNGEDHAVTTTYNAASWFSSVYGTPLDAVIPAKSWYYGLIKSRETKQSGVSDAPMSLFQAFLQTQEENPLPYVDITVSGTVDLTPSMVYERACTHPVDACEEIPAIPATCVAEGSHGGVFCAKCQTIIQEPIHDAALGHKVMVDAYVPATNTMTGLTEGSHCEVCGLVLQAQEEIPKLVTDPEAQSGDQKENSETEEHRDQSQTTQETTDSEERDDLLFRDHAWHSTVYEQMDRNASRGWQYDSAGAWYREMDGTYCRNAWKEIGGLWYFFGLDGYLARDTWIQGVYYVGPDGAMARNMWVQGQYYVGADGVWIPGMLPDKVKALQGQWMKKGRKWWLQKADGTYPANGWYWVDADRDGIAECYYFDRQGYIAMGKSVEGYRVNRNGQWSVQGTVQHALCMND